MDAFPEVHDTSPCTQLLMSLPDALANALNDQITLELTSEIAYLQLAAFFAASDLPGMSSWMRAQASEERSHAEKFMTHVIDREGTVRIGDIPRPDADISSPLEAFQTALEHEKKVSESIRNLYHLATEEEDLDAIPLLQWFINEQIEEEATVSEILSQIEFVHEDGSALLILDRELGKRNTPPDA